VNQENATTLEPNNQILATTTKSGDPLTLELGGHSGGVDRPREARVEDLDALEAAPYEPGLQTCSNRLDLG
jgi:hypothetical protein